MEKLGRRCGRLAGASALAVILLWAAPGHATADPAVTASPGMEIHQGHAVCMVGLVEPRLRVAITSGQCDGGQSAVTDRDHHPIGEVVLGRRQLDTDSADASTLPVEYEVIALARDVTASDLLPTGRRLLAAPGLRAVPGCRCVSCADRPASTVVPSARSPAVVSPSPTWWWTVATSAVRSTP